MVSGGLPSEGEMCLRGRRPGEQLGAARSSSVQPSSRSRGYPGTAVKGAIGRKQEYSCVQVSSPEKDLG